MLYLASTPELCALEVRVHLDLPPELIPDDYVLMCVELEGLAIETVSKMPADPAGFGNEWLKEQRTPLLRVPSVIIPESSNWLVNPLHPGAQCRIHSVREFAFDTRLWLPLR